MKSKLLKKLRQVGRNEISVYSMTTTDGIVTGMKVGYNENAYKNLFSFGDTEAIVKEKASRVYLKTNIVQIREKYSKYSRKYKFQK